MANTVTIKNNPGPQERGNKVKEVSFMIDGEYYGALIALTTRGNKPSIRVYRIDEGIDVSVSDERDKRG